MAAKKKKVTTLQVGAGTQLTPVAAPFALTPIAGLSVEPVLGRIGPVDPQHGVYRDHLVRVTEGGFARLLNGP